MPARTLRVQDLLGRIEDRAKGGSGQRESVTPFSDRVQQALGSMQQAAPPGQMGVMQQTPGGALHPLPGAELTDTFGAPRSGGRKHQGIDIFQPTGTPIVAPIDGISTRGGYYNNLGGHSVNIVDSMGNNHYFTHMDRPSSHVKKGQPIRAGDVIGWVGNSGNASTTPPHLHYSINEGRDNVINAFDFLTGGGHQGHAH